MSYQRERDDFIARMTREGLPIDVIRLLLREATGFNRRAELACSSEAADRDRVPCPAASNPPRLHPKNPKPCLCDGHMPDGTLDHTSASGQNRSGHSDITRITLWDWYAEQRIKRALTRVNDDLLQSGHPINVTTPALWRYTTQGDPRGYVLRVIPPSYAERNAGKDPHNIDAIGVPSGPSGIRW